MPEEAFDRPAGRRSRTPLLLGLLIQTTICGMSEVPSNKAKSIGAATPFMEFEV